MRIDAATRDRLARLIEPLDTAETREAYLRRDPCIPNIGAAVDLTRRYRWDLFYKVKGWKVLPDDPGMADSHIETVLKRIVPPLDVTA